MSGHSKWSKVKHQKESTDKVRGKLFTKLSNAIIIAVREGGGNEDPDTNFKLRLAIEKAKGINMPKENIQRAIERAKGKSDEALLNEVIYEAFGPKGVGIIIQAVTDNKQRTVAEIKNILDRSGGVLASSGAVSHFFKLVGQIKVLKGSKSFEETLEAAINFGADDIKETDDAIEIYTKPEMLHQVKESMTKEGFSISASELFYLPLSSVEIKDQNTIQRIDQLIETLENLDDIQKVYSNFKKSD